MQLTANNWPILVLGALIGALVVQNGGAETVEPTQPPADAAKLAASDPVNGTYLSLGISGGSLSPSSLLGQVDYARRLTPTQTLRIGLALSGNDDFTSANYTFSTSASVDYLFFLAKGIVEPYVGAGISFGYIAQTYVTPGVGPENATVYVPYGIDIAITRFLSLGLAGKLTLAAVFDANWYISRLSGGFGPPQITLALWF